VARPHARPHVVAGRLSVVIRVARNRGRPMTASTFSRLADIEAGESIKADEARNDAEI
jgi:hypothetical protein